jgi:hypothetical protein
VKKKNNKEGKLDMYVFISVELGKLIQNIQEEYHLSESQAKRYVSKIATIVAKK